jgi:hypothetical protein
MKKGTSVLEDERVDSRKKELMTMLMMRHEKNMRGRPPKT